MISLRFYGAVKKHYHRIDMNCDTPAQGLRLLMAQNHAFKKSMLHGKFRFRIDGVILIRLKSWLSWIRNILMERLFRYAN